MASSRCSPRPYAFPLASRVSPVLWLVVFACIQCSWNTISIAQTTAGRDKIKSETEVTPNVENLLRNTYSGRQQATLEMWRQRDKLRDEVQEASRHPDPEVAGRAKWVLDQWRRGALPNTPPELWRLLQHTDSPSAIERLLEAGEFAAAIIAVEESAGTIERDVIQDRVATAITRRFPIYIHRAVESNSLDSLLQLIGMVANSKEMAACRFELMRLMELPITNETLLPKAAKSWSAADRERATVLVLISMGKLDQAIAFAKTNDSKDLLHQCRMIGARWIETATDVMARAREAEDGSYEQARLWCLTLIAADRANNTELFREALSQVSKRESETEETLSDEAKLAAELRWKCLASHGELDAAFSILDKLSPHDSAAVAIDASRVGRAFDVLGFPLERVDIELRRWVDAALESQRAVENETSRSDPLTKEIREIYALVQCLIAIGRDDLAWDASERMCRSDVMVGSWPLREYVLSMLTTTKRSDWVVKLAVSDQDKELKSVSRTTIARTLADANQQTLEIVMEGLSRIHPKTSLRRRLESAHKLLSGEIPEGFDPQTDFQKLHDYFISPKPTRQLRQRITRNFDVIATQEIVHLFSIHGESELATSCLQVLAERGDVAALSRMAEHQLEAGRADAASLLFEAIFDRVANQALLSRQLSSVSDSVTALKARIGSWLVARRMEDDVRSEQIRREIRFALCAPSPQLRSEIAAYLADQGEDVFAMEVYETLLPMTVLGTNDNTSLYDVARSYSLLARKTNPAEAARWFDLAVGGTLDSINYRAGAYVTLPLYVRRWSVEAAIQEKDRYEIQRNVDRILKLDPLDIDFAERILPEMRKAGITDLADETLGKIVEKGIEHAIRFPLDAMTCNNLAWVAAMNNQHLDDALWLSQAAVTAEPESAIYRDTIAEVLFRLDHKLEAYQVEKSCLLDDPTQWHLHEQVRKYAEAINETTAD